MIKLGCGTVQLLCFTEKLFSMCSCVIHQLSYRMKTTINIICNNSLLLGGHSNLCTLLLYHNNRVTNCTQSLLHTLCAASTHLGLSATTQTRGSVPKVTVLQQAKDADGNLLYIDKDGKETTKKPESLPNYAPIYLTKGQLTFDTAGKLISPKEGAKYTPFDPQNGADLIVLNVDYGKFSTQYSQPFSVLSLTQDGFTSGRLDGISIDSSGTVRANYTNGQQQALGKLILANFASPNGLKQIGNANYVSTSSSGEASARRMATASSWPGSVSMMILRGMGGSFRWS